MELREYQKPLVKAFEEDNFRKLLCVWPRRCLSGDTHIATKGRKTKLLKNIKPGDTLLSWDGQRFVQDTVRALWKTKEKKTLVVKAEGQQDLVCSYDHRFACLNEGWSDYRNRIKYIEAKDLTQESLILTYMGISKEHKYTNVNIYTGKQEELYDIETTKHHNFVANGYVVHNSGKDFVAWTLMYREALREKGVYIYCLPTAQQARLVIWSSITGDKIRFPDMIPAHFIKKKNESEMAIYLTNGSILRLVGSDNYDRSIVGGNAKMFVFSEFALADGKAYTLGAKPILDQNNGRVICISTPRSKNFFYDLYKLASESQEWFCQKLTVEDTKHIRIDKIKHDIESGEISQALADQEFFCSFDKGQEGSVYSTIIDTIRLQGHITSVPYDPMHPVYAFWDIGVRDAAAIVMAQFIGKAIHIIDYYENTGKGLDFYVAFLRDKPYSIKTHIFPHDIRQREFTSGVSRLETARNLGLDAMVAPSLTVDDGIEATRAALRKCYFNVSTTQLLIKSLENYHYQYDEKNNVFSIKPVHDSSSHACFIGETLIKTQNGVKAIKEMVEGDLVRTPTGFKRVLKVHKRIANELCEINVGNSTLCCTRDHKIFTQQGLVRCDALSYADILEPYSIFRIFAWETIYGLFSKALDLKGFKSTILSLRMKDRLYLMDTFIDGMVNIIEEEELKKGFSLASKELYGPGIMEISQKSIISTIKTAIEKTTPSRILKSLVPMSTVEGMALTQMDGHNRKPTRILSAALMLKLKNGIVAMPELNGTSNMQKKHGDMDLSLEEGFLKKSAIHAGKNTKRSKHGKDFALLTVKISGALFLERTLLKGCVAYARLLSAATNTHSKKHAVKSVQLLQCDTPEVVYDLTVEDDNCYYANGYLVSNCDAMRMLSVSVNQLVDEYTPEELRSLRQQAYYGQQRNNDWF